MARGVPRSSLCEALLKQCTSEDRTRAHVQISAGVLRLMQADADGARVMLDDGMRLSAELGDDELRGWVLLFQGLGATIGGAGDAGRAALVEARALHRGLGVRVGERKATAVLGLVELTGGEPARARELVREALEIQVAAGDQWSQGQCHLYLGMIAEASGAPAVHASEHYRQAVEALRPYRDGALLPMSLAFQAGVVGRRDARRALRVIAAASSLQARAGGEFAPLFRARVERARSVAAAALGEEARAVWIDGERLGSTRRSGSPSARRRFRRPLRRATSASERRRWHGWSPTASRTRRSPTSSRSRCAPSRATSATLSGRPGSPIAPSSQPGHASGFGSRSAIARMTPAGRGPTVAIDLRHAPPNSNRKAVSMHEQTAFVLEPDEGRRLPAPPGHVTFKVRGEESAGTMTVFEAETRPGDGPRLHVHERADECIYVLSGDVQIRLGHELRDAPAGSFAFIPRGVYHRFQNVGEANSRIVAMFTPAGIEDFFESFAETGDVDDFFESVSAVGGRDVPRDPR